MSHSFKDLGISAKLIQGLTELGIENPTAVQKQAIPLLLEKDRDLIVQAQTGTGKTAAFGLPLLMKVDSSLPRIQGLIVAPTRELAKQIGKSLFRYTKYTAKTYVEVLTGGDKIDQQIGRLKRPTQIIVVTPGRLIDLLKRDALALGHVKFLILDEADEMLSMGFKEPLNEIVDLCKDRRSTWLFSATFPEALEQLIKRTIPSDTRRLQVDAKHVVNRDISHRYTLCAVSDKTDFIASFLRHQGENRGLIFCRTKAGAIGLGRALTEQGYQVGVLQGDLTQLERDKVMRAFKKERVQFLIATDVAARGIDVPDLSFVLHHQLPEQMEYYTHRSGRTARAGKKGLSLALIDPRELKRINRMEKELGVNFLKYH